MSGYIGNIPTPQATQSRQSFTATASQTSFATSGYTAGFLDVYLNGVHLLDGTDYTATNGSDIVLTTGAAASDVLEVVSYSTFEVADAATPAQGALADTAVQPADNISTLTNDAGYLTVAPSPFEPITVTGTTPSLDIGTYNFFDNGALSGDTTVSFASVPTEAKWTYSFEASVSNTWDVSTASYVRSVSVAAQCATPFGLFFSTDGTKMFVQDESGADVNEYNLNTAWNISTASYVRAFSVSAQDTTPRGLAFSADGTKMYITGSIGVDINEYSLSTAWNISTASYVRAFSVSAQDTTPMDIFFKPDGTKMYVIGWAGGDINEYSLSTAWNISTASYVRVFSIAAQDVQPRGVFFKPDGTKMYLMGDSGNDLNEYNLSTAWNISTASFSQSFSVVAQDGQPRGVFFKPDGIKMYFTGVQFDAVHEFDIGSSASLTLPASVQNPPTEATTGGDTVTYDFYTLDGGTTVHLIGEEVL